MGTFPKTARWKILKPDGNLTDDPSNPAFKNAQAPTIKEREAKYVPVKFNFSSYKFDIPIFSDMIDFILRWTNGREKKDKNGKVQIDQVRR